MLKRITAKAYAFLLGEILLSPLQKVVFSLAIIGVAFGARTLLHPLLGPDRYVFPAFYLAIVLIAFVAGTVPALVVSIFAAPVAYWAFSEPTFTLTYKAGALAALNFHILTTGINLLFLALLRRTLLENRRERQRAEAAAEAHAAMFREFNDRAVNHLQLVSALLDARSREEGDAEFAAMVARASSNTLLISNLHRRLNGNEDLPTDITLFLTQVAQALVAASDTPDLPLSVAGDAVELPSGQAISVTIAISESLRLMLNEHPNAIAVTIEDNGGAPRIRISGSGGSETSADTHPSRAFSKAYIDATVSQLNARYGLERSETDQVALLELPHRALATAPSGIDHWATSPQTRH